MLCKTPSGLTQHVNAKHPELTTRTRRAEASPPRTPRTPHAGRSDPGSPSDLQAGQASPVPQSPPPRSPSVGDHPDEPEPAVKVDRHPLLDGTPCDRFGNDLEHGAPPPPWDEQPADDFSPFDNRAEFEFAEFLYSKDEMSGGNIDQLMQILAALYPDKVPPFADHKDLYAAIDAIPHGEIPWKSFTVTYNGPLPDGEVPPWMTQEYEVWYRDPLLVMESQLGNRDFAGEMDWSAKRIFNKSGKRQYTDLMSGNWAWKQSVRSPSWQSLMHAHKQYLGYPRERSSNTWMHQLPDCIWQRQDDGVSRNG